MYYVNYFIMLFSFGAIQVMKQNNTSNATNKFTTPVLESQTSGYFQTWLRVIAKIWSQGDSIEI